jgi:hypothetical protein
MRFLTFLSFAALAVALELDRKLITIRDAQFSGNGCPEGSVSTSISPDKTVGSFTISPNQNPSSPRSE